MTPMERSIAALSSREPDRVPVFLGLTGHGARAVGVEYSRYCRDPMAIAEGQCLLQRRFGHDCVTSATYAAVQVEWLGAEIISCDPGPPNMGRPPARSAAQLIALVEQARSDHPARRAVLETIALLADRVKGTVPILSLVVAPASLPLLLYGVERWLQLVVEDHPDVSSTMKVTTKLCMEWARQQVHAGADVLCLFDPMASATMLPAHMASRLCLDAARQVVLTAGAPVVYHLGSGRAGQVLSAIVNTGASAVAVSADDDLADAKQILGGHCAVAGNLNNLAMIDWSPADAEREVRACIRAAARGGGYILADQHGEIPFAVPDETIAAVVDAARRWGGYPVTADV